MTPVRVKVGYLMVGPTVDGKNVQTFVHVMVIECFVGPRPKGMHINHIDGVKTNNAIVNLEYCSRAENMAHASRTGLFARGARHYKTKLTEDDVRAIRAARDGGESLTTICARYGIGKPAASMIANRKTWRHVV